jgi:hypothetical protein
MGSEGGGRVPPNWRSLSEALVKKISQMDNYHHRDGERKWRCVLKPKSTLFNPMIIKSDSISTVICEKYFDISILTIPLGTLLMPDIRTTVVFGIVSLLLVVVLFLFTIKQTIIFYDTSILVERTLRMKSLVISLHRTEMDRESFNVRVSSCIAGGGSDFSGSESFTILLCNKSTSIGRVGKFNNLESCKAMAASFQPAKGLSQQPLPLS